MNSVPPWLGGAGSRLGTQVMTGNLHYELFSSLNYSKLPPQGLFARTQLGQLFVTRP